MAIKRLNKGTSEEQTIDFLSELGTIAHVDHPNTAKLVGYGVEGGTYLVLELSPLGSLGSLLHGLLNSPSSLYVWLPGDSSTNVHMLCVGARAHAWGGGRGGGGRRGIFGKPQPSLPMDWA